MSKLWSAIVAAGMLFALLPQIGASANDDDRWVTVGQQALSQRDGRAVITVSRGGGRIGRLRLAVVHGVLWIESVRIVYDTGATESLRIGAELSPGRSSAVYELAGYGRRIDAVEITGEAGSDHGGRALIRVLGEVTSAGPGRGQDRALRGGPGLHSADGPPVVVIDKQQVDLSQDQHIFRAGEGADAFEGIRLRSRNATVRVRSLLVVLEDGSSFEIPVGARLAPGAATPTVALGGQVLREVVVLIEPARVGRLAQLELEGMRAGRGSVAAEPEAVPDRWRLLGEGTGATRDVVKIGAEAGKFSAVALRVAGGHVVLARISIVYADGRRDAYPVAKEIPDGTFTPGIPLKGDGIIDRVELIYSSGDAKAIVEVYGEPKES